jgi:hypothetical protein
MPFYSYMLCMFSYKGKLDLIEYSLTFRLRIFCCEESTAAYFLAIKRHYRF